jgi:two-component system LytT family response regulator
MKKPLSTLLIDDERLPREDLKKLLTDIPAIQVVGEAGDVTTAIDMIEKTRPELLFLDIEMPGRNGFDLLTELEPPHPLVIFTTAYNEYALQAFSVNALDYLLKPIDPQRLASAVAKVRDKVLASRPEPTRLLDPSDHIFVRSGESCWFVKVQELILLEADSNYTRLVFGTGQADVYRSISSLEARLPTRLFARANRSQIVNLTKIRGISPWFGGTLKATMCNGREVEFSRRQAQLFRDQTSI